jgi:toxin ParE1/3/4
MKLSWAPDALEQLEEAVFYIAEDDPAAAMSVYERVHERADELLRFPWLGTEGRRPGTRELAITKTPYVLVYRVVGDAIEILHCWHGAQSRRRR